MLLAVLNACQGDETLTAYGAADTIWAVTEIDEQAFAASATISFPEPGKIRGQGPCNQYSATQTVPYPWFKAEAIVSTRRSCENLAAENTYLRALAAMTLSEVSGDSMILSNEDGATIVFEAVR
ncbi:hypothetical protein KIN_34840 [Litoreibacter roseus]|uniref:DUF306 domain-containing protein n=2 Tax=Litoreibacter roseus TaxID=2601869 RepID=A0A6N6JKN7_9RHOB|nr:hypothetical protein KIN_34840 [Litoreibacter roseus]